MMVVVGIRLHSSVPERMPFLVSFFPKQPIWSFEWHTSNPSRTSQSNSQLEAKHVRLDYPNGPTIRPLSIPMASTPTQRSLCSPIWLIYLLILYWCFPQEPLMVVERWRKNLEKGLKKVSDPWRNLEKISAACSSEVEVESSWVVRDRRRMNMVRGKMKMKERK